MSTTGNIDRNDEGPDLGVSSLSLEQSPQQQQQPRPHKAIVLFYKYWIPTPTNNPGSPCSSAVDWLHQHPDFYLPRIYVFQKELCHRLGLKGRILLATEGINATLSATSIEVLAEYRTAVEAYDLFATAGYPPSYNDHHEIIPKNDDIPSIFAGIDWKESLLVAADDNDNNVTTTTTTKTRITTEPFPNLKVSIVKELVSSGNRISVQDLQVDGRSTHLSPHDFHHKLLTDPNVVLVDVRNTFEYNIGHFVHPHTHQPAMNPEMVTFSSFDQQFCQPHASLLQGKTVLMYCTGGIRCEKASVMLQQRGVASVYQLQGGIHRYLETYGETGCFKGKNFQFDQRVSLTPSQQYQQRRLLDNYINNNNNNNTNNNTIVHNNNQQTKQETTIHDKDAPLRPHTVVGTCIECRADYDGLSGARICTVCRDLVLVCPTCQEKLREYHCQRHAEWKAYFTFLEIFDYHELQAQKTSLQELLTRKHNDYSKHVRKTLRQQIDKISQRMEELQTNPALVSPNAPRRCRSCRELQGVVCNGLCWGFWKTTGATREPSNNQTLPVTTTTTTTTIAMSPDDPIRPIQVEDVVTPGPHWNEIRYGSRINPHTGRPLEGIVAEIKSWGTGSDELDCVAVEWKDADRLPRQRQVQIYRWGAKAVNGSRLYDVCMSELTCH